MRFILSVLLLIAAFPAQACERGKFFPASSPQRFVFQDRQGTVIRLAGLGLDERKVDRPAPYLLMTADAQLKAMMKDAPWIILPLSEKPNTQGMCLVHAQTRSGSWIQRAFLSKGLAYVIPMPVDRYAARLLEIERIARRAEIGLWQRRDIVVRNARTIRNPAFLNSWQIVEGIPVFMRDGGRIKQLCLHEDPRQSLCFLVLDRVYHRFAKEGTNLLKLPEGQALRGRGRVFFRDGLKMFIGNENDLQIVQKQ